MMHALDPAVHEPIFKAIVDLIPPPPPHPLGCHRRRISDWVCFRGILMRLVSGMSWTSIEAFMPTRVSDTTLRARRDEWIRAGVFAEIFNQAIAGYHKLIGFNLANVIIDGSDQLAPCGGEAAAPGFKTRGRQGWKWVIAVDDRGVPITFTTAAANRNDYPLMYTVLDQLAELDLAHQIDTVHADRGFGYREANARVTAYGINRFNAPPRNDPHHGRAPLVGFGPRWIVESTNAWMCAYGQLRRNTDRKTEHRHAAMTLAITLFITHRLQHPRLSPIR
jgi:hypothetical protein